MPRLVRFVAGLVLASKIWYFATPLYNVVLSWPGELLLELDPRFHDADLVARSGKIAVRGERGLLPPAAIPADQLTYNFILLVALFASNRRPLRDGNIRAFLVSLLIVMALHPIALAISIESTYANRIANWSEQHYGDGEARFWLNAEIFYRLLGMFGVAFGCWWVAGQRNGGLPFPDPRS
jgi:hypothetical protein